MNTISRILSEFQTVEVNADSEYAQSFGIEKGDTLFLDCLRNAVDGDLILVQKDGEHQFDTYNEGFTVLDENSIGVLVSCLKTFKDSPVTTDSDDILSAEFLEVYQNEKNTHRR